MAGREDFREGRVEEVEGQVNGCSTETVMWRAGGGYMCMQLGSTDAVVMACVSLDGVEGS